MKLKLGKIKLGIGKGRGKELDQRRKILLGSTAVSVALIVIGIILGDPALLGNLIIISIFAFIIPLFFERYTKYMWIKAAENQFPNLVRDLADAIRSGMSFKEAIALVSKANYGKLSDEVNKMHNRLSWGTPFLRVIEIFGSRVKGSKLMTESLNIITESFKSGGNVAKTLDSIARDMIMFKEIEAERESMTRQHVMIMYGIFFMFLGISIMIIYVMVPMIGSQATTAATGGAIGGFGLEFTNPCQDINIFPCNLFALFGYIFNITEGITLYYTSLFFMMVLLQGVFTGLIAGQLGENSVIAGSKHSLIMVAVTLTVFLFLAKAGMLPTA